MTNHTLSNVKDKIIGSAKSTLGNVTNNEKMKTKGDHQYVQAVELDESRKHQEPHDGSLGHVHDKGHHGEKGYLHDNKGHYGDQALHPGSQGKLYDNQGATKDNSRVHKAEAFGERIEGNVKHAAGQAVGSDKMKQSGERDRLHGQRMAEGNVVGVEGHKQQPFAQHQTPEQLAQQPQQHAQNMQSQYATQGLAQDAQGQYPAQGHVQDSQNQYPAQGTVQDSQNQYSQQPAQQHPGQQQQYPGQQSSF
ncbi:hypothetical protein J3F82_000323 [Coemansia sp. RSA 637]|nr:hypothetical protein J3F82_000323 [Coemansia sp. RSA 637]